MPLVALKFVADHPNGTQVVPSGTAVLFAVLR